METGHPFEVALAKAKIILYDYICNNNDHNDNSHSTSCWRSVNVDESIPCDLSIITLPSASEKIYRIVVWSPISTDKVILNAPIDNSTVWKQVALNPTSLSADGSTSNFILLKQFLSHYGLKFVNNSELIETFSVVNNILKTFPAVSRLSFKSPGFQALSPTGHASTGSAGSDRSLSPVPPTAVRRVSRGNHMVVISKPTVAPPQPRKRGESHQPSTNPSTSTTIDKHGKDATPADSHIEKDKSHSSKTLVSAKSMGSIPVNATGEKSPTGVSHESKSPINSPTAGALLPAPGVHPTLAKSASGREVVKPTVPGPKAPSVLPTGKSPTSKDEVSFKPSGETKDVEEIKPPRVNRKTHKSLAYYKNVEDWQQSSLVLNDAESEREEKERVGPLKENPPLPKPTNRKRSVIDLLFKPRSPEPKKEAVISSPTNFNHALHIKFEEERARYVGVPAEWREVFNLQFGVSLESVPKIKLEAYDCGVPAVLAMLERELLENGGVTELGIFRLAPDHDICDDVKKRINRGLYEGGAPVHVLANLIKVFLRELPPNLLNIIEEDTLMEASQLEEGAIGPVVEEMPEPNRSCLLWLLDLIVKVSSKESENKMGVKNMAIVLAPNLFSLDDTADPMTALVVSQKIAALIITMVKWRAKTKFGVEIHC